MKPRKKLIISLVAVCLVTVATIVTVVAVLAAKNGTLAGKVNVKYTATDVSGTVSANYKLKGEGQGTAFTGGTDGVLTVDAEAQDGVNVGTLTAGDITLDKDNRFVVFTFNFTNSGSRNYTAAISYTDDTENGNAADTNIVVEYSTNNTKFVDVTSTTETVPTSITVTSGNEATEYSFYVKVSIDNIAKDAEFSGSFNWTLTAIQAN